MFPVLGFAGLRMPCRGARVGEDGFSQVGVSQVAGSPACSLLFAFEQTNDTYMCGWGRLHSLPWTVLAMLPLPPLKCVYLVAKKVDLPKLWRQISQPVYFGLVGFVDAVAHAAFGVFVYL
jgi:hypothetical protein